jgi:hypothetical protein
VSHVVPNSTGISDNVSESPEGNPLLLLMRQGVETADHGHANNPIILIYDQMLCPNEILLASLCDIGIDELKDLIA